MVPIGFVSDHMEVKFDLDVEAAQTARRLGLTFARAATPGTDPRFVSMITDLVCERLDGTAPLALGALGRRPGRVPGRLLRRRPGRPASGRAGELTGRYRAGGAGRRLLRGGAGGRRAAGVLGRDRAAVVQTKSSPTDVVTQMDRAAEQLIRDRLQAARPGDAILGEEGGETGAGRVRWIVDPLDGTVNYLYGLPDWAVSIAAEVAGVVVAGAVCVPLQRSTFRATLGGGAWLRLGLGGGPQRLACNTGVALAVTRSSPPALAIRPGSEPSQGRWWRRCCRGCATSGAPGPAAVDLCSVAAGRVDAYYEQGVHYWDIAAGGLIAREAGAETGGLRGEEAGTPMTLAAAPELFTELRELLESLGADRQPPG